MTDTAQGAGRPWPDATDRSLPFLAALLLTLVCAPCAQAGQYVLAYDFGSDLSGWSGYVEPGYLLCGRSSPAGCPDVATNRILARTGSAQAIWSQGRWEWTAPPGTTIVGGALAYRTRMRHAQFFARIKVRNEGTTWDAAPTLVAEQQTVALTDQVAGLPGGFRQLGISLYAHPAVAGLVTDVWDDYVTLARLDVTVDDPTPPSIGWVDGEALLDNAWHRGSVCATISVADAQSGLAAVWLVSGSVTTAWEAPRSGSQYQPGIAGAQPRLCLPGTALGDGVHAGSFIVQDASGGRAAPLPFTVRLDATAPAVRLWSPAEAAGTARPAVELEVWDATSGVASVAIQVDGVPLPVEVTGGRARGRPASDLAYGAHALTWSVVDVAGNVTAGSARFNIPDTSPPVLGSPQPRPGAVLAEGEVLTVAVAVSDAGSGVDPASGSLKLDGTAVANVWQTAGVLHAVGGVRLAAGVHHLALAVGDQAGNVARLAWDVTVPAGASSPAGSALAGTSSASPGVPGKVARLRAAAVVAVVARVGAARPRVVTVRLRARARLRIVLRISCGTAVRTLRVRANARGIATVRVPCAAAATVRMVVKPARLLVRITARRLPLRLQVRAAARSAPTVARVSGRLAEARGRIVVLEALGATGWRRAGQARADATGRFATSFAITHAGQFAVRARVPALAGIASAPVVLTMR